MAGGFGTRLRPLTCNLPKPMVPMGNRPMMEHILTLLQKHQFTEAITMLYFSPDDIRGYFGDGKKFDVKMKYLIPTGDLGTAGCVKFAEEDLDETFAVMSADVLTETGAAYLMAATEPNRAGRDPFPAIVEEGSGAKSAVANAQRTLRLLGFYRGRTDGRYNSALRRAIIAFQKAEGLITDEASPGAGRIGPLTKNALLIQWKRRLVAARALTLLTMHRLDRLLVEKGHIVRKFLKAGEKGDQVSALQVLLIRKGLLAPDSVSGFFGSKTKQAVIAYQIASGIIANASDRAAGYVGPATMMRLRRDARREFYLLVRAQGWGVL